MTVAELKEMIDTNEFGLINGCGIISPPFFYNPIIP